MPDTNHPQLIEFTDSNFSLIEHLAVESQHEGYKFIQRTIGDWNNGTNKFSAECEKLYGLIEGTKLIGICGINRDPFTNDLDIGRVRHLYILRSHRRKGYATLLMNTIIDIGRHHFSSLRLFTDNPLASNFYETLCFKKIDAPKASHILIF
jgi:GNAT superfamily N-acetyltransferase